MLRYYSIIFFSCPTKCSRLILQNSSLQNAISLRRPFWIPILHIMWYYDVYLFNNILGMLLLNNLSLTICCTETYTRRHFTMCIIITHKKSKNYIQGIWNWIKWILYNQNNFRFLKHTRIPETFLIFNF